MFDAPAISERNCLFLFVNSAVNWVGKSKSKKRRQKNANWANKTNEFCTVLYCFHQNLTTNHSSLNRNRPFQIISGNGSIFDHSKKAETNRPATNARNAFNEESSNTATATANDHSLPSHSAMLQSSIMYIFNNVPSQHGLDIFVRCLPAHPRPGYGYFIAV